MIPEIQTPPPFNFNLLKHHVQFPRQLLRTFADEDRNTLQEIFQKGGNLWCDYYYGELSPLQITTSIVSQLQESSRMDRESYAQWINGIPTRFRNVSLADGSRWTLLLGDTEEKYIHVHPARYSPLTVRVRFLALKTAILYFLFIGENSGNFDYRAINEIRTNFLQVSPVKAGSNVSHQRKVMELLGKNV